MRFSSSPARDTVTGNMLATKVLVAKSAFVLGSNAQYEFAVNGKGVGADAESRERC